MSEVEAVPEDKTLRDEANKMSKEQQLKNLHLLLCKEYWTQGGKKLDAQEAVLLFAAAINLNPAQLNQERKAFFAELNSIVCLVNIHQTAA